LRDKKIPEGRMTDRQAWAVGRLLSFFVERQPCFEIKDVFQESASLKLRMVRVLRKTGYSLPEIKPILAHLRGIFSESSGEELSNRVFLERIPYLTKGASLMADRGVVNRVRGI
jgi:hypothetical protein